MTTDREADNMMIILWRILLVMVMVVLKLFDREKENWILEERKRKSDKQLILLYDFLSIFLNSLGYFFKFCFIHND